MHEFELLADPTRRRIVELLAHQELAVVVLCSRLGDDVPVSRSAVSHQLRVLRDAEFVEVREWGTERRYRLGWNAMDRLDAAVELRDPRSRATGAPASRRPTRTARSHARRHRAAWRR